MGQAASRQRGTPGETQRLLPSDLEEVEEVDHDHDGCYPRHGPHDICPANPYADLPVYTTIHRYVVGLRNCLERNWLIWLGCQDSEGYHPGHWLVELETRGWVVG